MNFIHFEQMTNCEYPVGGSFHKNFNYIKSIATVLDKTIEKYKPIALACRGTSGTILSGAVGYILEKKGRHVTIIVSRKEQEHSHGHNMEGVYRIEEGAVVVVIDDFIASGATINTTLHDLDRYLVDPKAKYPILCISNAWDEKYLKNREGIYDWVTIYRILRFETIICNKRYTP